MVLWLGAIVWGWPAGGAVYGPVAWHAHEMLFGYATAALAGFLLTTIPNWTGRLPVSGFSLLGLVLLWLAGRLAMAVPDGLGAVAAGAIDSAFLIVLAAVAAREILAGRNWRNLKIVVVVSLLATVNIGFHGTMIANGDPAIIYRGTIALFVMLIGLVGGRIIPSFTRNWLAKRKAERLPMPFDRFDVTAMVVLAAALVSWTIFPQAPVTAAIAAVAALGQGVRLARWRTASIQREPMLLILHVGYAFVPLGLIAVAAAATGVIDAVSALHVLTVGAIGTTTVAVMTRATLGHTGRPIAASVSTIACFLAIVVAATTRPLAAFWPDAFLPVLAASGTAWVLAFALFTIEYGVMVLSPRRSLPDKPRRVVEGG
jgi:uncharacterized protein involved in response to NO